MKKILCFSLLIMSCYVSRAIVYKLTIANNSSTSIRGFRIRQSSAFFKDYKAEKILIDKPYINDKNVVLEFKAEAQQVVSVEFSGNYYSVLLLKGPNIFIEIDDTDGGQSLSFTGLGSKEYNYFILNENQFPEKKINNILYYNRFNATLYKKATDSIYTEKLKFAKNYIQANQLSLKFRQYIINDITSDYINNLYNALTSNKFEIKNLPTNFFHLSDSLVNNLKPLILTKPVLFSLSNKYIFFSEDVYTQKGLTKSYNTITKKFVGNLKEYLLANLIGFYAKKQSQEYNDLLIKKIENATFSIKNTLCLNYIKDSDFEYRLLNTNIPNEILEKTYLQSYLSDSLITLKQVLNNYSNKHLYIDFWANWCVACREDIAVSIQAKDYLQAKGVIYLYISIDKIGDKQKWKDASVKDKITQNQYLLVNGINSPFGKFMSLTSIPRYLILDNVNKIKNYDAPRPTPLSLNELKQSINEILSPKTRF